MRVSGAQSSLLFLVVVLTGLGLIWMNESTARDSGGRAAASSDRGQARKLPKSNRDEARRLRRNIERGVELFDLDEAQLDALAELGYADRVVTASPEVSGVTIHDRERAWDGLNLYKSFGATEAHLMDMDGRIVHTWEAPDAENGGWCHVELLPGGRLLGMIRDKYVEMIDWDSTLLWRAELLVHHDLDVDDRGRVLTLIERVREVSVRGNVLPVLDHGIAILSPEGELLDEVWLSSLFADRITEEDRQRIVRHVEEELEPDHVHGRGDGLDAFHANTIESLRRDVPGLGSAGQVIVSLRALDVIAVLDLDTPRLVWEWGPGDVEGQHQPTLLPNGNLLVFDNGKSRNWSRVVEVDPREGQVVWEYRADVPADFFTASRGGSEQLPNGNVLVAESNRGRVFEVTRDGEIVWEFLNPDVMRNTRGTIYRMHRLTSEERDSLPLGDS